MSEQKDGGPAFPGERVHHFAARDGSSGWEIAKVPGMSLRDYFAGQALVAILSNGELVVALRQKYGHGVTPHIADTAYEFADAMLEAREVK